jgi:hypothetical protein
MAYMLLTRVVEEHNLFSNCEVCAANKASELYRLIGRPSETGFEHFLKLNSIRNCPITPSDAKQARIIHGPDIAVIKGTLTGSNAAPKFQHLRQCQFHCQHWNIIVMSGCASILLHTRHPDFAHYFARHWLS